MQKSLFRRGFVFGLFIFFIGTNISFSQVIQKNTAIYDNSIHSEKGNIERGDRDVFWKWAKSAGGILEDYGLSIVLDTNGNIYITGGYRATITFGNITLTSQSYHDVFIAKLSNAGVWLWAKSAGGILEDYGLSIVLDTNGNSYIIGYFQSTATFGNTTLTSQGSYDIFVAKLNNNGVWQWAKKAGGSFVEIGTSITLDNSGNIYITGYFQGSPTFGNTEIISQGGYDIFVAKLSNNGIWQWAISAGSVWSDNGNGIAGNANGDTYIIGTFRGTVIFGNTTLVSAQSSEVFIAKLSNVGVWLWAKSAGGAATDSGIDVTMDTNGNTYITGIFEGTAIFGSTVLSSPGYSDIFVAKLSTDGVWQWAKKAGGNNSDSSYGIEVDTNGNTYITGIFEGTAIFGSTVLSSQGYSDIFVAKLSTDGVWQWAKSAGGSAYDYGKQIAVDASGNTYLTGYFSGNATFGSTTLISLGSYDVYIAKLFFNTPPIFGTPTPTNESTNQPLNLVWSIPINDPEGDQFSWTIQCNNGQTNSATGVTNGTKTLTLFGLTYSTPYKVWVNATDPTGSNSYTRRWYIFTTKANLPPVFGTPTPANGSTSQPLGSTWSILINEPEGDLFSWTIQCSNGQTNSGSGATNGTKTLALSGLAYSTTYKVWVNATDPTGSNQWTKRWYTFTTKGSLPPVLGTPTPSNGSTSQPLSLTWNIPINDPEGDTFSWTIQCSNGQVNSGTGATNGTKSLALSSLAYSTAYKIWVNATDPTSSGLYTRKWYTFTTKQNTPPSKPERPSGLASGKINVEYTYTTKTSDGNDDMVYYNWSWGDGSYSGWLGPFTSNTTASGSHTWTVKDSYSIKVKAKDTSGAESPWSDPLPIKMPYSPNNLMLQFLELLFERFPHAFPILLHILGY